MKLTDEPLVTFDVYPHRAAEMQALVERIRRDLREGLSLSRNLLVVTVGNYANFVQKDVVAALRRAGIDTYIPAASGINREGDNREPNRFWHEGAVTVTTIHRAKGNEADVVYVVGLDKVARDEGDIAVRNGLFVAMSRSRGWLHLSGAGMVGTPFEREVRRVLDSGPVLTFRPVVPRRRLDDEG